MSQSIDIQTNPKKLKKNSAFNRIDEVPWYLVNTDELLDELRRSKDNYAKNSTLVASPQKKYHTLYRERDLLEMQSSVDNELKTKRRILSSLKKDIKENLKKLQKISQETRSIKKRALAIYSGGQEAMKKSISSPSPSLSMEITRVPFANPSDVDGDEEVEEEEEETKVSYVSNIFSSLSMPDLNEMRSSDRCEVRDSSSIFEGFESELSFLVNSYDHFDDEDNMKDDTKDKGDEGDGNIRGNDHDNDDDIDSMTTTFQQLSTSESCPDSPPEIIPMTKRKSVIVNNNPVLVSDASSSSNINSNSSSNSNSSNNSSSWDSNRQNTSDSENQGSITASRGKIPSKHGWMMKKNMRKHKLEESSVSTVPLSQTPSAAEVESPPKRTVTRSNSISSSTALSSSPSISTTRRSSLSTDRFSSTSSSKAQFFAQRSKSVKLSSSNSSLLLSADESSPHTSIPRARPSLFGNKSSLHSALSSTSSSLAHPAPPPPPPSPPPPPPSASTSSRSSTSLGGGRAPPPPPPPKRPPPPPSSL